MIDTVCLKPCLLKQHQLSIKIFKNKTHVHDVHVGNIGLYKVRIQKNYILYILIFFFHLQCCMRTEFQKL
jgi:hypothetical protein